MRLDQKCFVDHKNTSNLTIPQKHGMKHKITMQHQCWCGGGHKTSETDTKLHTDIHNIILLCYNT